MFRDLLSSRWFQVCLAFFVLVVGGSLLYSWHVLRTTESDMARHDRLTRGLEKQNETRPAETVNVPTENETPVLVNTPDENTDTQMPDATEPLENETENLDLVDAFLPDDLVLEEAPTEDGPVSPFGFGPYPKVPADYPKLMTPTWIKYNGQQSRDFELMDRVLIKLWNHGDKNVSGAVMKRGLVYPLYPNTTYVEYREVELLDGTVRRFISSASGTRGTNPIIPPGGSIPVLPEGVTGIDMDNAGINPYEFLNLK